MKIFNTSQNRMVLVIFGILLFTVTSIGDVLVSNRVEDLPPARVPNQNRCTQIVGQLEKDLFFNRVALLKDAERETQDPYWGRLSQALHTTPEANLKALFTGPNRITFEDIDDTWWLAQAGYVKINNQTLLFLSSLREFMSDYREAFSGGDDTPFKILQAVDFSDRRHSYAGGAGMAVKTTDKALRKSEELLLLQAIQESRGKRNQSNRFYDWFLNYFSPHYDRILRLVRANENFREVMQISAAVDEPTLDAIQKYSSELSPDDLSNLQSLITNTSGELDAVRKIIVSIYGKELSSIQPLNVGELRLRAIDKKIVQSESEKKKNNAISGAEAELDQLDAVMAHIFAKRNPNVRPMSDYHPTHLQIRYSQHRRETRELRDSYFSINQESPQNADYQVEASWKVTATYLETKTRQVTSTDSEGKSSTSTETYTETNTASAVRNGTFTLKATYNEILDGKIVAKEDEVERQLPSASSNAPYAAGILISAVNSCLSIDSIDTRKTNWILQQAGKAREMEAPLREKIDQAIQIVDQIADGYPANISTDEQWKLALDTLEKTSAEVDKYQTQHLKDYAILSVNEITTRWGQDRVEHFKQRNSALLLRYRHLVNRVAHCAEQVNRKMPDLAFQYSSPNYSREIDYLKNTKHRNRVQQYTGGVVLALAAAFGGYNHYHPININLGVESTIKKVEKGIDSLMHKHSGIIPASNQQSQ